MNGGIKPIRSFKINNKTVDIYVESSDGYISRFFGKFDDKIGIGYCQQHDNGTIVTFYMLSEDNNGLQEYNMDTNSWRNINLTINSKQSKLYRHKLTLNGIYVLMYNSTSNLKVSSVANLRTIMKISSEGDQEILPVCASDATSMVTLVVTDSLCQVDGADVTSVSDTVKPL